MAKTPSKRTRWQRVWGGSVRSLIRPAKASWAIREHNLTHRSVRSSGLHSSFRYILVSWSTLLGSSSCLVVVWVLNSDCSNVFVLNSDCSNVFVLSSDCSNVFGLWATGSNVSELSFVCCNFFISGWDFISGWGVVPSRAPPGSIRRVLVWSCEDSMDIPCCKKTCITLYRVSQGQSVTETEWHHGW